MKDGKRENLIEFGMVVRDEEREEFLALLNAAIEELRSNRGVRNVRIEVAPVDEAEANFSPSVRVWPIL